jgi:signal transduction histidine kinase
MIRDIASHNDPLAPLRPGATLLDGSRAVRGRLMIVDDDEGPRKSLRIVFQDDYEVFVANAPSMALKLARQHRIDVAILDIRMPEMSGIELLAQLKKIDPNIQIIMLTAYETTKSLRQSINYGACEYLNKPFDIHRVRDAVEKAIERRHQAIATKENSEKITQVQNELESKELDIELARIKEEIYPGVLHDIMGPITTIRTQSELLEELIQQDKHINNETKARYIQFLQDIQKETERAADIGQRYVGLLNPTQNQPASLTQTLSDLEDVFRIHPAAKNTTLKFHPNEEISLKISRIDLFQILYNIIENACHSTPNDGTPLHIEIKTEVLMNPIDMSFYANSPTQLFVNRLTFCNRIPLVAIHVKDNGQGIPPKILERIFEPYFSTKPQGKGTGLGLAIVERLLRTSEGGAFVKTDPGHGTTFTLYIPAAQTPSLGFGIY